MKKNILLFFISILFLSPSVFAGSLHFPFLSSSLFYPDKAESFFLAPHRVEFERKINGKKVFVFYRFSHFGSKLSETEQSLTYQEEMKAEMRAFMLHKQGREKIGDKSFLFSRFSFSNDEGLQKGVSYSFADDAVLVNLTCFQKENALEALLLCSEIAKKLIKGEQEKEDVFSLSDEIFSPDASLKFAETFWKSGNVNFYIHYLFALSLDLLQENKSVCTENDEYCKALQYQLLHLPQIQKQNEKLRAEIISNLLFEKKQKARFLSRKTLEKKSSSFDILLYLLSLAPDDSRIFSHLEHLSFPDQKHKEFWKSIFLNRNGYELSSSVLTRHLSRLSPSLKCRRAQVFIREKKWKQARRLDSSLSSSQKTLCTDQLEFFFSLYDRQHKNLARKLSQLKRRYPRFYASASYAEAAASFCAEGEKKQATSWFQTAIHLFPSELKFYKAYLSCLSESTSLADLRFLQAHVHHLPSSTEKIHFSAKLRLALKELKW